MWGIRKDYSDSEQRALQKVNLGRELIEHDELDERSSFTFDNRWNIVTLYIIIWLI